jgi:N-dimethylarginine dimethylaminohydrolase
LSGFLATVSCLVKISPQTLHFDPAVNPVAEHVAATAAIV